MAGYTKTYTLDFTASGDTVYTGTDKLEDNIDSLITWVNDLKDNYSSASAPTSPAPDEGQLWWDSTNNIMSVYTGTAWSATALAGFPSGTKMLFYQDTAPTGWTIDTTVNDKVVFITKGSSAGGQTGGAAHSTGSWTISGLSGDSHTLTSSEMPSHTHFIAGNDDGAGDTLDADHVCAVYSSYVGAPYLLSNSAEAATLGLTGATGSGGGHTHTVSSAGTWRPAAYSCLIATKD